MGDIIPLMCANLDTTHIIPRSRRCLRKKFTMEDVTVGLIRPEHNASVRGAVRAIMHEAGRPESEIVRMLQSTFFRDPYKASARNDCATFVACERGFVIGFITMARNEKSVYVHMMGVLPSYRRLGVGSQLLEEAQSLMKCGPIMIKCNPSNRRAYDFFHADVYTREVYANEKVAVFVRECVQPLRSEIVQVS